MKRKTKQPYTEAKLNPVQIKFNEHHAEIMSEDPSARLVKDAKGGLKIIGNLSAALRKKIEG